MPRLGGVTRTSFDGNTPASENARASAHAPAHAAAPGAPTNHADGAPAEKFEPASPKKSLLLRLLDRFGTNAPKSEEQRAADVAYRTAREAAFDEVFPALVADGGRFDDLVQRAHGVLNEQKEFSTVVRLSALLVGNTLSAGKYRTAPNRAGDYLAPSARDVARLMDRFGETMGRLIASARGHDDDALLVAGWALTVMIRVHPFADGNGRTARAAMNLVLAKSGCATIEFPADSEGIYKKSAVWARLKDHMRGFTSELGWTLKDGAVPPSGYAERLAARLDDELASTTIESLRARADVSAIAAALRHARAHGFQP